MARLVLLVSLSLVACNGEVLETPHAQAPPPGVIGLSVGAVVPGEAATLTVTGLQPGERAAILRGARRGAGPCFEAAGGLCADISGGVALLGYAPSDAQGVGRLTVE